MDSQPVTLGDWYEILKVEDYGEAADLLGKRKSSTEWLSTFLLQWAPEVIVRRQQAAANTSREDMMRKLAQVKSSAARLASLLDDHEVMKFLQIPPHPPFQSELQTRMLIGEISVRAHDAANSPNLLRGDGKQNSGTGKAVATEVSPEQLCATIIGEAWLALHGSYPSTSKFAAAAASAYWIATGGSSERSFGSNPIGKWRMYFDRLKDEHLLWGNRKEMKRQLNSWMHS